jgi:hypothetical protein
MADPKYVVENIPVLQKSRGRFPLRIMQPGQSFVILDIPSETDPLRRAIYNIHQRTDMAFTMEFIPKTLGGMACWRVGRIE